MIDRWAKDSVLALADWPMELPVTQTPGDAFADSAGPGGIRAPAGGPDGLSPNERSHAMWVHISHAVFMLIGIPVVTPLILWLIRKDDSPFVDDHGREALNFEITLLLYTIGIVVLGIITCGIGFLAFLPWYVLAIIGTVLGAKAAYRGGYYRYPMCLRLIPPPGAALP